jgi:hypothetical protein
MSDPNKKPKILGPNNLGDDVAIVEMGGEEDTQRRPLPAVLREQRERAEKRDAQPPPPPRDKGEPAAEHKSPPLGPNSLGIEIIEMGGEEDTRVRPLPQALRDILEQSKKRKAQQPPPAKDSGDPGPPSA